MTLEEKVGQLLMAHFNGDEVNGDAEILISKLKIGSIIYYNWANGLNSPKQIQLLSHNLQKLAKQNSSSIPLFIAVDQEGGPVTRLTNGFFPFPGNKELGKIGDPKFAEECAYRMGVELLAVGINMNLAPVVDINSQNGVMRERSFGNSPEKVMLLGKAVLDGYRKAKVISVLKHFPGVGAVTIDSHDDLPVLNKTKQELKEWELFPYADLAKQADAIMTAHLMVPHLDSKNCATLSKTLLDILRNEIGFEGIILSDSLIMEGLLKNCASLEEAALHALNAGCDLLILGGKQLTGTKVGFELTISDVEKIHAFLVAAVKNGALPEKRVNDALFRILKLKRKI